MKSFVLSMSLAVSLLSVVAVSAAPPSKLPACAAPEASRPLPEAVVCLREAGLAARGTTIDRSAQALFKHAGETAEAGRYAEAERTLDCADAVISANGEPALRYELVRQRGILEYGRDRIPQALKRFECALKMSTAGEDAIAIARDMKNVGSSLRRLGDFRGALQILLKSLEIQRANGKATGAVLNNIADVYRELKDHQKALDFYREAQQAFGDEKKPIEVAHTLENMAAVRLDLDQGRDAEALLREALAVYRKDGNRQHELLIHESLIRAALVEGDLPRARNWVASANAIATEHDMELPPLVRLQIAKTERMSGRPEAARAQLNAVLASVSPGNGAQAPFLEELAALAESTGDPAAIAILRKAHEQAMKHASTQYDQQLGWMRTRFETEERIRTIETLQAESRLRDAKLRQRTLLLWLMGAAALIGALSFWLWWQRRRHAERMQQELQRAHHEQELARYRREADGLAEDRQLLQVLLDSRDDAVCLLDAEGSALAVNQAALVLLGTDSETLAGRPLIDALTDADGLALVSALERMEDNLEQRVDLAPHAGARLLARLTPWAGGDGLIVLTLKVQSAAAVDEYSTSRSDAVAHGVSVIGSPVQAQTDERGRASPAQSPTAVIGEADLVSESASEIEIERDSGRDAGAMRQDFRRILVELMLATVDAWERTTATSRLELAEKSRIWRVNIDDGRLRARAMERYLGVSKLPQNPRWRDVIRTAYYVLGQCEGLSENVRAELQTKIDALLAYTRRDALV